MHSGVCASAEVKRWHDEVTFLPCKHNTAPLRLSQAACVCVCVCVLRGIKLVFAGTLLLVLQPSARLRIASPGGQLPHSLAREL